MSIFRSRRFRWIAGAQLFLCTVMLCGNWIYPTLPMWTFPVSWPAPLIVSAFDLWLGHWALRGLYWICSLVCILLYTWAFCRFTLFYKALNPRVRRLAIGLLLLGLTLSSVALGVQLRSRPAGHFHAWNTFSLHEDLDVLSFSGGKVQLQTCCGDESWGTYQRESDGNWYWSWASVRKTNTVTRKFRIEPGVFGATFIGVQNNTNTLFLRRRLFISHPL